MDKHLCQASHKSSSTFSYKRTRRCSFTQMVATVACKRHGKRLRTTSKGNWQRSSSRSLRRRSRKIIVTIRRSWRLGTWSRTWNHKPKFSSLAMKAFLKSSLHKTCELNCWCHFYLAKLSTTLAWRTSTLETMWRILRWKLLLRVCAIASINVNWPWRAYTCKSQRLSSLSPMMTLSLLRVAVAGILMEVCRQMPRL